MIHKKLFFIGSTALLFASIAVADSHLNVEHGKDKMKAGNNQEEYQQPSNDLNANKENRDVFNINGPAKDYDDSAKARYDAKMNETKKDMAEVDGHSRKDIHQGMHK